MRAVAAALALYGVAVQAIGVYAADDAWNREPTPLERAPRRVWDWGDLQIVRSWHNGFHRRELWRVLVDAFRDPVAAHVAPIEPARARRRRSRRQPFRRRWRPAARQRRALRITNRSSVAWPAFNGEGMINARYLIFLLVRWFAGGEVVPGVGDVIPLPENVAPGEPVRMAFVLPAPSRPGDYEVELRVTQAIDGQRGIVGARACRARGTSVVRSRRGSARSRQDLISSRQAAKTSRPGRRDPRCRRRRRRTPCSV